MARWKNLTKKQKRKLGTKKNFRQAKKEIKSRGENINSARQVVKAHRAKVRASKSAPKPAPRPTPSRPMPTPQVQPKPTTNQSPPPTRMPYPTSANKPTPAQTPQNRPAVGPPSQPTKQLSSNAANVQNLREANIKAEADKRAYMTNATENRRKLDEKRKKFNARSEAKPRGTASKVNNINDYDTTSFGRGHKKGKDHLSVGDLKELHLNQGFSKQEVAEYAEKKYAEGTGGGSKAYKLLQKYKGAEGGATQPTISKPKSSYGEWKDLPPGAGVTADFRDSDGDGIDDRKQSGPGQPKFDNFAPQKPRENTTPAYKMPSKGTNLNSGNRDTRVGQESNQSYVNTQDNDINTTITGDNNTVNNMQDNSIRNYGGNQRNFTYIGGKNPLLDTPASAATMAGFYDVDDSPSAQAKFVDMYTTMNRDNQKARKAMTPSIANEMISKANKLPGFSHQELDKVNRRSPQIARDRATNRALGIFGDRYKAQVPDWESPERQKGIEQPDYDKLYDKYTSF